jgi:cytochrome c oxidase subunit 3
MNPPVTSLGTAFVDDGRAPRGGGAALERSPAQVFLAFFLVVVTMLFVLLTIAYLGRSQFGDWRSLAAEPGGPLADASRLWFNTALLAASSIALQWGRVAARRRADAVMRRALTAGGALAVAFIAAQIWLWSDLAARGHAVASNPAASFFYLITALHGAHLAGGLIALAVAVARIVRTPARSRAGIEMVATYWHFLLLVWLAMFALLASPPSTIEFLAALCGFR